MDREKQWSGKKIGEGSLYKQDVSDLWQECELVPLYVHVEQVYHLLANIHS